ncbi:MAG: NADH-quinone oxidoreductase subunit NuoH [Thermaceae bacterium]
MNGPDPLFWVAVKALLVILGLLTAFAYMTWVERRLLARFQIRLGPNRVGPLGLLQPLADAIKSIFKEDLVVEKADRLLFILAPLISFTFALLAFGAIPFGPPGAFFGLHPWVLDLDLGLLYLFAVGEMAVYGIFLAGWASGSKYSLLGSLRASASLISYELGLGVALLSPILLVGSLNLREIVDWQAENGWLAFYAFPAFLLFLIASLAEAARTPFDLPEAEQELVGGYHTEYSSIKWALFQMAEYVHLITASALIPTLFLGGWRMPGLEVPFLWILVKMALFLFLFIWIRATWFRLRYDQLLRFGWGFLFPVALVWFLVSALVVALGLDRAILQYLSLFAFALVLGALFFSPAPRRKGGRA